MWSVPSASDELASAVGGRRICVRGVVQGMSLPPFAYRIALDESVRGSVRNDAQGVAIEAFGECTARLPRTTAGLRSVVAAAQTFINVRGRR